MLRLNLENGSGTIFILIMSLMLSCHFLHFRLELVGLMACGLLLNRPRNFFMLTPRVGCVFPMSFGPNSAWGSKETMTIWKTHTTLLTMSQLSVRCGNKLSNMLYNIVKPCFLDTSPLIIKHRNLIRFVKVAWLGNSQIAKAQRFYINGVLHKYSLFHKTRSYQLVEEYDIPNILLNTGWYFVIEDSSS